MGNFKSDLKDGQEVERTFGNLLERSGATNVVYGFDNKYDISCDIQGEARTFEVKFDKQTITSPNLAIEYESRGKPSGITTSVAGYWVYKIYFEGRWVFAMIKSSKLKELILSEKYFRDIKGGDDYTSKLYLFKKEVYVNACFQIIG